LIFFLGVVDKRISTCSTISWRRPKPIMFLSNTTWRRTIDIGTWWATVQTSAFGTNPSQTWKTSTNCWLAWRTRWSLRTNSWTQHGTFWRPYSTLASWAFPTMMMPRPRSKAPNYSRRVSNGSPIKTYSDHLFLASNENWASQKMKCFFRILINCKKINEFYSILFVMQFLLSQYKHTGIRIYFILFVSYCNILHCRLIKSFRSKSIYNVS